MSPVHNVKEGKSGRPPSQAADGEGVRSAPEDVIAQQEERLRGRADGQEREVYFRVFIECKRGPKKAASCLLTLTFYSSKASCAALVEGLADFLEQTSGYKAEGSTGVVERWDLLAV